MLRWEYFAEMFILNDVNEFLCCVTVFEIENGESFLWEDVGTKNCKFIVFSEKTYINVKYFLRSRNRNLYLVLENENALY